MGKKKQTPRGKKGYHSVKKRKHSFVKVTGTSGAPRLRPDFVLLNAPLSDRGKKSVCNGLLFTGNIHPSSMTLGGPVVLLVCAFKRHYLHNQSEYRKSPTHFCSLMLCELRCGAILHVLHTYTYIYFIYARNSQCSCRANIFEKIS